MYPWQYRAAVFKRSNSYSDKTLKLMELVSLCTVMPVNKAKVRSSLRHRAYPANPTNPHTPPESTTLAHTSLVHKVLQPRSSTSRSEIAGKADIYQEASLDGSEGNILRLVDGVETRPSSC